MSAIGKTLWAGAEGCIPGWSHGPGREFISHEALCVLNTGTDEAVLELMIYYSDREPSGPCRLTVPPQRTKHFRLNDLKFPEPIPLATDFSWVLKSSVPVVVQHTRLDSRQAENALMTTVPFSL